MKSKRSFGIMILGGVFIFGGGITVLFIILEVIESVARYGFESVGIISQDALRGFFIFLVFPIILYITGVGMMMQRAWARRIILYVLPLTTLLIVGIEYIDPRVWLLMGALIVYLSRTAIKRQFDQ